MRFGRELASVFLAGVPLAGILSAGAVHAQSVAPPNVVLILADDLGYTDISPFGSEINTPNIARLAAEGLSFTNYHTAANCAPARAMLLTGVDSHRNGVPNIPESIPPEQLAYDHYQGVLSDDVVTLASLLRANGYHTYMTGKWHLGQTPSLLPSARGFERTIALADTGADNWEQRTYLPIYDQANWYAGGMPHTLPDDFYSSEYFIDKTIEFIAANERSDRPFFAYIPFQAVHIPVQAPKAYSDKYAGFYDEGWTVLRERRRRAAVEPIVGVNFAGYLAGAADQIHPPSEPIGYELGGSSVLFKGDYKIVINRLEQNESEWHLHNIKEDPGETTDLIREMPELFAEMLADYQVWEEANNVLPMPEGYNRGRAIFRYGFN